jgi:predicted component of type VI protein secretion system
MANQVFEFKGKSIFIGRSFRNDIQLYDLMVSRKHLQLFRTAKSFYIEDLGSTNGTLLNGETIAPGETYELNEKDTIVIGNTTFQLSEISSPDALSYQPPPSSMVQPSGHGNSTGDRRSRASKNLQIIYMASEFLDQPLNIVEMLEEVLESIFETLPRIDRASILMFEKDKIKEVITRSRNGHTPHLPYYSRSILDRVVRDGTPVKVSNTTYKPHPEKAENMDTLQIRSVMCAPLVINTKVSGAIYVDSPRGSHDGFRKEDLLLLNALSRFLAAAYEVADTGPGSSDH